jgi:hypothetical protein
MVWARAPQRLWGRWFPRAEMLREGLAPLRGAVAAARKVSGLGLTWFYGGEAHSPHGGLWLRTSPRSANFTSG